MHSESFGKVPKQNTVINHEKLVKEEIVKDTDSDISGIRTIWSLLSKVKNEIQNHSLEAQDSSKLFSMLLISVTFKKG